jgi:hypothetical protein
MPKSETGPGALSEAELDKVSGGMDVQIGEVSSSIRTSDSGSDPSFLQKVVSLVVDGLNQARRPR